jgi:PAS domain S-box-containing protein
MNDLLFDGAVGQPGFAVMILGPLARIESANADATRLFRLPEEDGPHGLEGRPISDFLPFRSLEDLTCLVTPPESCATVTGMTGQGQDGAQINLALRITPWTDAAGRPRVTLMLREIVPAVPVQPAPAPAAGDTLEQDITLSSAAVRGAGIGVFAYRPDTDEVTVSDIWRELVEIPEGDPVDVQVEWRSRVHPDDLAAALEPIRACLAGETDRASCEYRLRMRNRRRWRWMRTDISVLEQDAHGKVTRLIGAMSNISDQKATENALRHSVEQFRSAFEYAPIGKAIVTLHGSFLRANAALCELLGYTEEDLQRTDFQSLTHPEDLDADQKLMQALIDGKIPAYEIEKRYIRANGSTMWGVLSVGMVRDADGNPEQLVAQIVDVTERRRLNELKGEFVATVSHELRTPLTSVLGALGLLNAMDTEALPDSAQRLLFIAQQNGQRLLTLINDILDFEKFSARQMPFTLTQHRITALVEEAVMINLAQADKYGVRFEMQSGDPTATAWVDGKRFQQVMANLLSNAAKFADTGSVVHVRVEANAEEVKVSVSNLGRGIPEDFRSRIFTPFSQAELSSTRSRGGTGLGLSIAKQIVEQSGGRIGFDSTDGETTFWFTAPTTMHKALAKTG